MCPRPPSFRREAGARPPSCCGARPEGGPRMCEGSPAIFVGGNGACSSLGASLCHHHTLVRRQGHLGKGRERGSAISRYLRKGDKVCRVTANMSSAGGQSLRRPFCLRHLFCTILSIGWTLGAVSRALRITSTGTQTLYVAENQDIEIGCIYEVEAEDIGSLDIEWTIISPDTMQQDRVILTYLHDQQFEYLNPLSGRFGFMEVDPSHGNASVRIRNLQASDTNTFQCKVKKAPGIDSRKVTVGVHGKRAGVQNSGVIV
ncbi:coxsackievirus and adenovirus receptor homolog [Mustelus asterias]